MPRDEFPGSVKTVLAKRAGGVCSNPACGCSTVGPHTDPAKALSIGVAAHIAAASMGGPRFDASMSADERSGIENGIWLCQSCAKLVDSDTLRFSLETLRRWKIIAEAKILRSLSGSQAEDYLPQPASAIHTPIPRIAGLTYDEARERLIGAGWQPHQQRWSHASEPDMQHGNGLHFWEKGYHEIINASGTGLGHCTFGFIDVYRNKLIVVTAGEVCEAEGWTACVWNWYFQTRDDV